MNSNYDYSLAQVLKDEGGYSNNPSDPGGPTNYGITIGDYRRYVKANATAADVRNMNIADAKRIYKSKYWDACNCDKLPNGVDYAVFDYGVNSGIGRAKSVLTKFRSITDPVKLINAICDERLTFLRSLRTWSVFGAGWGPRVQRVRKNSIVLANSKPTTGVGAAGAVVAGGVAAATQAPHHHWPYIIAGTVVAVIVVWLAVRWYKHRKGTP